jgi:(4-O-methyl)-D-glucuronate---lignin esterase
MNHRKSVFNVAVFILTFAFAGALRAQQPDMNWPRTNAPVRPPAGTISLGKPLVTNAPAAKPTVPSAAAVPANPPAAEFMTNAPAISGLASDAVITNGSVVDLSTTSAPAPAALELTNAMASTNPPAESQAATNLPVTALMTTNVVAMTNAITVTNAITMTNAVMLTNLVTMTNTVTVTNLPVTNFPVEISVNVTQAGPSIPHDFTGLSFESAQLLIDTNTGLHYFRPGNLPLIRLFHTFGVKSLRIGGNTSDRDARQLPSEADIDSLFQFAKAADVKVIYCLRLYGADARTQAQILKSDVETAQYIWSRYEQWVDCFSIGQEPSAYPVEKRDTRAADERMGVAAEKYKYSDYQVLWKKVQVALTSAIPDIRLAGPSVHNNGEWARNFIRDFGHSNNVVLITEHLYPGGAGGKVPAPEIGVDRMLSGESSPLTNSFPKVYEKLYENFAPMAATNHLPYRLEEVNNYFNGGATNVSNTFASALWGVDFMYWWASHEAAGLNFHTGDKVAAGNSLQPSKYTAYYTSTNGYLVRPLGYGIKTFELGASGKFLPVTVSNVYNLNLTAYATGDTNKDFHLTIINKEHGEHAHEADVTVSMDSPEYRYCETIYLLAPTNLNEYATANVTLGGAFIRNDGTWNGKWKMIERPTNGMVHLKVPPCSAVVVACTRANYDEASVGSFVLPDAMVSINGSKLKESAAWTEHHRADILKLYEDHIYGTSPKWRNILDKVWDADKHALGDKAIRKQVNLEFYNYKTTNQVTLHVLLYTPSAATDKVPVFLALSFLPNYRAVNDTNIAVYPVWNRKTGTNAMPRNIQWDMSHSLPIEKIISRGYGVAVIDYNDIEPDLADGSGWKHGVRALYLEQGQTNMAPNDWGAIGAWSWGASRVLDYLETDREVDASRVILVGQSRLGKAALWAGAEDPRIAMVIASCSGEMGAALARRDYGETVNDMCANFAYQFCPNFLEYSNNVSAMPVDSHMLLSLIAPRPLYLNTGSEDRWSDPRGEYEAAIAATPIYQLFEKQGVITNLPPEVAAGKGSGSLLKSEVLESYPMPTNDTPIMRDIGFQVHTGKHEILPSDWDRFLDFADMHFFGKQPPSYANTNSDIKTP